MDKHDHLKTKAFMATSIVLASILIMLLAGCATEDKKADSLTPDWVLGESKKYPKELYLLGQETPNIKLVYSDEGSSAPLIMYAGRLFGPLKIWEINYPSHIKENPADISLDFPDPRVTIPDKSLYG